MKLLRWRRQPKQLEPPRAVTMLHAGRQVRVVGTSYRQKNLHKALGKCGPSHRFVPHLSGAPLHTAHGTYQKRWFLAVLVREPGNPHDPNAIAVFVHEGPHIGYLSRENALLYQKVTDELTARGATGGCPGYIVGGGTYEGETFSLGARLCLSGSTRVLRALLNAKSPPSQPEG